LSPLKFKKMKKRIALSASLLLLIVFFSAETYAQQDALYASYKTILKNSPVGSAGINARAIKNFKKEFTTIDNAEWYEIDKGFISKFEKNGIQYRAGYDKKGNCLNTMRTYDEKQLPEDIRKLVKSSYYDYSIKLVEEVTASGQTAFIIHIENSLRAKKIKVEDGETTILQEYEK